ncbi:Ribonuclease P protein component 1 [uncultured archaeon]|nr:Ribonuclease P protein component 1 [uncultured archaeon]
MDSADYSNKNIVLNELIGLRAKVVKSSDPKQEGLDGTIIDETKNTLLIETGSGVKRLVKASSTFKFYLGNRKGRSFVVEGKEINFRPHERIEKSMKFYKRRKL